MPEDKSKTSVKSLFMILNPPKKYEKKNPSLRFFLCVGCSTHKQKSYKFSFHVLRERMKRRKNKILEFYRRLPEHQLEIDNVGFLDWTSRVQVGEISHGQAIRDGYYEGKGSEKVLRRNLKLGFFGPGKKSAFSLFISFKPWSHFPLHLLNYLPLLFQKIH